MSLRAVAPSQGSSAPPSGAAGGDLSGTYPNPTVSKVNGKSVASIQAQFSQTAQAANVATTTVLAVPAAGIYRLSAYAVVTQAGTTSSTLPSVAVGWTDADSGVALLANTVTPTNTANAAGAFGEGSVIMSVKAGANITIATANYASAGATAMQYAVRAVLEQIG